MMAKDVRGVLAQPKRGRGRPPSASKPKAVAEAPTLRSKLKQQKQSFVQEEILQAAAELIATRGFRAVTLDDISACLGFSKSVIYYYLKSKNDILWRIFTRIYESYFDSLSRITDMDADPDTKLYEIIRLHASNVMTHRAWTAISIREEAELTEDQRRQINRKKREYDATLEAIYSKGVEQGLFLDMPPRLAVTGVLGACNSIYTWYSPEGALSVEEIAAYYANLLANGFRTSSSQLRARPDALVGSLSKDD